MKEQLKELYINQNLSRKEVMSVLGISKRKFSKLIEELELHKTKEQIRESIKQTNLERYGVENPNQSKEIREKVAKTNLERYGSMNPMHNKEVQQKSKDTIKRENVVEKRKQTVLQKYGCEIVSQNKDIKEKMYRTCLERYGYKNPACCPEVKIKMSRKIRAAFSTGLPKQKEYKTRSKNNSWNTSKPEEQVYALLVERFSKEDVLRQYKSNDYPYSCDFYIKSIDTYVEYQGSWCHGKKPFDINNPVHQRLVEKWETKDTEYFSYAVKIWTVKDPEKRRIAKENNLNWLEFFNIESLQEWLNSLDIK